MNLKKIERIIVHGNCPDGMASAILLYDALRIEPEFMLHSTDEYLNLEVGPGMLFCDIAPPYNRYKEFIDVGTIVLDHHKGSKNIVEAFGDNGKFADEVKDPGKSGAWLAWEHVWRPICEDKSWNTHLPERFARLTGVRDTWQDSDPDFILSGHQASTLVFYSWDYWKDKLDCGIFPYNLHPEMEIGKMIFEKSLVKARKCADQAFIYEDAGFKVAIFNDPAHLTSDVSEMLREEGVNVIAGFSYSKRPDDKNPLICFSLRSDGSIDVADLAETIPGGGGHTKAAGFAEVIDLKESNGFAVFQDIFEDYVNYHMV